MAATGKLPWFERGGFDVKTFLIAVVVIGVLVGIALWALLAVRARQLLPKPPHPEPHSQVLEPRPVSPLSLGALGYGMDVVGRPV
jgi:hypothetical protein